MRSYDLSSCVLLLTFFMGGPLLLTGSTVVLSFQAGRNNPLDKVSLRKEEQQNLWNDIEQRTSCLHGHNGKTVRIKIACRHCNRERGIILAQQQQRSQIVSPDPGERDQKGCHHSGDRQRQEDAPEDAPVATSIQNRRLFHFGRDRTEKLAEKKDEKRRGSQTP